MALQRLLYPLFIIIFSIIQCYNCLQEDPLNNYLEESSGYDYQAYPSYFSAMEDGKFKDLIKPRSDVLSLKSSEKVGSTSTSVKTISVDDYGAKADGTDDTQVSLAIRL